MIKRVARVLALIVAPAIAFSIACNGRQPAAVNRPKLVVLGFDGMDPDLVQQWIAAGQLPTIAKLAQKGAVRPLETTHSPESPTAWASFATGVNPGKHNIYDFLVRDTNTAVRDPQPE